MPKSNNTYLERLRATLHNSPFVHDLEIAIDDREEVWFLRGDVYFINNTRLHFRELHIRKSEAYKKAYR